jgi:nitrate reductase assembly molybdenum cofactor insertion protein NarJ
MTEGVVMSDREVRRLLGEATAWRLLGLLFERPREGWHQEVEMLSREVADPEITAAGDLARAEANEGLYLALLGPGGPVSLRGVSHRGMEDPGRIIADIQAFYGAFAFQPATEEAPDHLAVETGFLGYLCLKEAYARACGAEDEAEIATHAAARFRTEHLSALAWPVAGRLEHAGVGYLARAAAAVARRAGPPPDTAMTAEQGLPSCDDCHMSCGLE